MAWIYWIRATSLIGRARPCLASNTLIHRKHPRMAWIY